MIAVGVDAGGTSTVAAVSDGGRFVREVSGPPANPTSAGLAAAGTAIAATIEAVVADARPDSIYVGAAGAGRPDAAQELVRVLERAFPQARIAVGHDALIALRGAVAEGPGAVLIAGTGSIAYAECAGNSALVGGHGYLLGDEGSAFALGMGAIRLYTRVLDGRAPRDETSDLAARTLGVASRAELHRAIYDRSLEPAAVAALAPSIIAFAGKGNRAASKLVQEAARELGDLIKAAARAANVTACAPIVLAGGLMRENSLLTFLLETRITGDFTGSEIVRGGSPPVYGALRLAERAAPA